MCNYAREDTKRRSHMRVRVCVCITMLQKMLNSKTSHTVKINKYINNEIYTTKKGIPHSDSFFLFLKKQRPNSYIHSYFERLKHVYLHWWNRLENRKTKATKLQKKKINKRNHDPTHKTCDSTFSYVQRLGTLHLQLTYK